MSCPHQMPAHVEAAVLELRRSSPSWGPRRQVGCRVGPAWRCFGVLGIGGRASGNGRERRPARTRDEIRLPSAPGRHIGPQAALTFTIFDMINGRADRFQAIFDKYATPLTCGAVGVLLIVSGAATRLTVITVAGMVCVAIGLGIGADTSQRSKTPANPVASDSGDSVSSPTGPTGIPGWYQDPAGAPGQVRYWNGTAWGEPSAGPERRRSLWSGVGAVLAGLLVIYIAAAPYITVYRMKSVAEKHDGEALSEFIDFPSVRQSLKDQFNMRLAKETVSDDDLRDNPFAALGSALAGTLVEKMVDAYVTPAGIRQLMAGEDLRTDGRVSGNTRSEPFSGISMAYQSVDKFVVTVKDDDGEDTKFVLRRRGIGWKLTEIIFTQ